MINEKIKSERVNYIGGSDAPAILGLSRFRSPFQVWGEKTGRIIPKDISDKTCIKIGNALEDFIARDWAERNGKKVRRNNKTFFSKEYSFIGGNIDRDIVGESALLEVKTAGEFMAEEWKDKIPTEYLIQALHYLYVTGYDKAYICCLIGNRDFKEYTIVKSDYKSEIEKIIEKEVYFWNNFVIPQIPPAVNHKDTDVINDLYKEAVKEVIPLDDTARNLCEILEGYKADKKNIEEKIETIENQLKMMLKDKTAGTCGNYRVFWDKIESERIDTKKLKEENPDLANKYLTKTEYRKFSIKKNN